MTTNYCHSFLALNLKFLHFLQFFLGISTVIYSAYLLNQWQNQAPVVPSPPAPSPAPNYFSSLHSKPFLLQISNQIGPLNLGIETISGLESDFVVQLYTIQLPAPWFIYFLMMVGVVLCCMSCIGHIAAEAINGCCLCFYILLDLVLILLEAALVAFIAIDQHWEKDLPFDPTGELEKLRSFAEENADICKWLGVVLITVQALSLLLSLVLRAVISTRKADSGVENGFAVAWDRNREPLLNTQPNQSSGSTKGESRGAFSDIWTNRIRQKYGLNNESSKYQSVNQNASPSTKS